MDLRIYYNNCSETASDIFSGSLDINYEGELMKKGELLLAWNIKARELLLGKRIVKVEYMGGQEAEDSGWHARSVRIILDDGTNVLPMMDDEGNNGGALWLGNEDLDTVLPVLSLED